MNEAMLLPKLEVAKRLGISRQTIETAISTGELQYVRIRQAKKFSYRHLADFVGDEDVAADIFGDIKPDEGNR